MATGAEVESRRSRWITISRRQRLKKTNTILTVSEKRELKKKSKNTDIFEGSPSKLEATKQHHDPMPICHVRSRRVMWRNQTKRTIPNQPTIEHYENGHYVLFMYKYSTYMQSINNQKRYNTSI
jgi:hypothetical protein